MAFFRDVSATTYLHEQLQDEQKDGQQKIEKTYRGIGRIQDSYRERGWRAPKTKQNVLRKISPVFFSIQQTTSHIRYVYTVTQISDGLSNLRAFWTVTN